MEKDFIKNRYAAIRCANNISARKLSFELNSIISNFSRN